MVEVWLGGFEGRTSYATLTLHGPRASAAAKCLKSAQQVKLRSELVSSLIEADFYQQLPADADVSGASEAQQAVQRTLGQAHDNGYPDASSEITQHHAAVPAWNGHESDPTDRTLVGSRSAIHGSQTEGIEIPAAHADIPREDKPCGLWASKGACKWGMSCRFRHDDDKEAYRKHGQLIKRQCRHKKRHG
eukprot:TRINITY_DN3706_c0_g1_i2.p1 TRINITY_DN3706_c0_g1~~TRINITY_DN3706_c0_g1_i2.p1  ORF type:complete len:210 (-),score=36.16 TRINITY_DN3706_c0_g1_i2:683-1252(-)